MKPSKFNIYIKLPDKETLIFNSFSDSRVIVNEEFLKSLELKLNETTQWPSVYMFKFIVPSDNRKMAMVEALFEEEAQISTNESSGGKYISITIKIVMLNALEVIEKYRNAAKIDGLIAL